MPDYSNSIWSAVACYRLRLAKLASPCASTACTPNKPPGCAALVSLLPFSVTNRRNNPEPSLRFRGGGSKLPQNKAQTRRKQACALQKRPNVGSEAEDLLRNRDPCPARPGTSERHYRSGCR